MGRFAANVASQIILHLMLQCKNKKQLRDQSEAMDEDTDEFFPTQVSAVNMDDSQLVILKLELGNYFFGFK